MSGGYETDITWPESAESVILTGTFDNWSKSVHCVKGPSGFSAKVLIPYGKKTDFKFIVDGHWTTSVRYPTGYDNVGNLNNYITAPATPPPSVLAVKPPAEPIGSREPEPVTPITKSVAPTAAVTPMSVPESSIAPYPGLTLDSGVARSVVESFLEVVSPHKVEEVVIPDAATKTNEPALALKSLADATAPSAPVAAAGHALSPALSAASDKVSQGLNTINGVVSPHITAPHTHEPTPVTKEEKNAEPGHPMKDLASLTGAAPIVAHAKEVIAPYLSGVQEKVSPAVAVVGEKVSPYLVSAKTAVGPALLAAQEKAAPIMSAVQEAVHGATATTTEALTAHNSDVSTPGLEFVAEKPPTVTISTTEPKFGGLPAPKPAAQASILTPTVQPEPATAGFIPSAAVDLAPSPVEPKASVSLPGPAAFTPSKEVNISPSLPVTPGEVKSGQVVVSPSGDLSVHSGSAPTTPTKGTMGRRTSSFGAKFFPSHSRKNSGDSTGQDGASPGKGSVKKSDSVRSKRTSFIGRVKHLFHHDRPNGTSNDDTKS